METLTVTTNKKKEIKDITDAVHKALGATAAEEGLVTIFVSHTTAAISTADLDPGTDLDMLDAFGEIVPKLRYRHPHDPSHVGDHIMASLIGPSVSVPFRKNRLLLGTWQKVVLVELDGPRERNIALTIT